MKKVIKDLEDRLADLESENQELKNRLDDIEGSLPKENFYCCSLHNLFSYLEIGFHGCSMR